MSPVTVHPARRTALRGHRRRPGWRELTDPRTGGRRTNLRVDRAPRRDARSATDRLLLVGLLRAVPLQVGRPTPVEVPVLVNSERFRNPPLAFDHGRLRQCDLPVAFGCVSGGYQFPSDATHQPGPADRASTGLPGASCQGGDAASDAVLPGCSSGAYHLPSLACNQAGPAWVSLIALPSFGQARTRFWPNPW